MSHGAAHTWSKNRDRDGNTWIEIPDRWRKRKLDRPPLSTELEELLPPAECKDRLNADSAEMYEILMGGTTFIQLLEAGHASRELAGKINGRATLPSSAKWRK